MDLNKHYNNAKLESRRQALIRRARADEYLHKYKSKIVKPRAEVAAAFRGDIVGPLSQWIREQLRNQQSGAHACPGAFEALLNSVAERSSLLEKALNNPYFDALVDLTDCCDKWVRLPKDWRPGTYNLERQFSSLLRHLLAKYPVPVYFDEAWIRRHRVAQGWFIHIGHGENLRKAKGLPIELTKAMAHHALHAPAGVTIMQALRFGQARGMNVEPRVAREIIATRLGNHFGTQSEREFWSTVINFFALHPMIDAHQVGPIIDYLHHQRYESAGAVVVDRAIVQLPPAQPNLTMRGRDPVTLVHQVDTWHRQLARKPKNVDFNWPSCGIDGYARVEGEGDGRRKFVVKELLNTLELRTEGQAMHHCVATYAQSCLSGRVAIYSMTVAGKQGEQRMVTIEVDVKNRQIVQVRKRYNEPSTPLDQRILNAWATTARLSQGRFALSRAY